MANPNQDARSPGTGRYERTPHTAERDAEAAALRAQRWSYAAIANHLGMSENNARIAVKRALTAIVEEPARELLRLEAEALDALYTEALAVLQRDHVTVSHGKVITTTDPETGVAKPLLDDGPKLAAIDRLVKVRESYRKLFGIDQPSKVEVSGGVKYEVVGVDPEDLK